MVGKPPMPACWPLREGQQQQQQQQQLREANSQNHHQQQFSASFSQSQLQGATGGAGNLVPVKFEQQMGSGDQNVQQQQPLQSLQRGIGSAKLEQQYLDPSLFLQQQQQQHQHQQLPNQSQQQWMLQMQQLRQQQQQQQQELLRSKIPQQRVHLQQQLLQQSLVSRCAQRLTRYMFHQKNRPEDNNIGFWRKFVAEYFAPNAKRRWCVSRYGSGRQTTAVFPQDLWHCDLCNCKPGRGFEIIVEVLPRLYQIKYASGTLEELLYVDVPREHYNASGQLVLDYAKAVQESVFQRMRIVREGHLRVVFNPDLKIASWEFCARRHEELIPRRMMIPQLGQLGAAVQKYHSALVNTPSFLPAQDLHNTCDSFVISAQQLAKAVEVPQLNELGYTKRYVRCLQISEVVNCMNDLIDYSKMTGSGPIASLINFPRRTSGMSTVHSSQARQQLEQQQVAQNPTSFAPPTTLRQNSMNSRQDNQMKSVSLASSVPPSQPNTLPPFTSPALSTSSNTTAIPVSNRGAPLRQPTDTEHDESPSSVERILRELTAGNRQQQDNSNRVLGRIGSVKNLNNNNLQYDWRTS
ncbi:transcriptional corepressor SEUSS-like isoform X2 [Dioscorea cayenensis subsp. rotundata]|uniref:Transcriptional corepressor SEUSS-like isoform X2 n=1 Tax=Dioscorea cayennensis subsp. rotundata TaxID=55577 RepID=A0AB40BZW4_DIOCR|nr:transcriptional corepressor SEUSS-like isoform X2 [Dioscorea cayenensis subsp. rotundata]